MQPRLRHIIAFTLAVLAGSLASAQTPATELAAALRDVKRLPPQEAVNSRYLSLYAVPPEKRNELLRVASYALNALSRSRVIARPTQVTQTLWRLRISDYATDHADVVAWTKAWERLAQDDPYWHLRTEIAPQQVVTITRTTNPLAVPSIDKTKIVTIDGGWVGVRNAGELRLATGSFGAILRADWFVANALIAPRYYEFTGVPGTEAEFQKSLGVDPAAIARLRADLGANLLISNVTNKERRVTFHPGPLGGYWFTLDVEETTAAKSFLRRPVSAGGFFPEYDASEIFAVAPNGTFRIAVFNRQGQRQDTVKDKIAKDTSDPHGDGIITVGVSCLRCHAEGLRPFTDDQSRLLTGRIGLQSYDAGIIQRALEFYNAPRMLRQMRFDVETYADAVEQASGYTIKQAAEALAHVVREHDYLPVKREQAAREIGVEPEQFATLVERSGDPLLLLLAAGRPILRNQWTSSFAAVAIAAETQRKVPK